MCALAGETAFRRHHFAPIVSELSAVRQVASSTEAVGIVSSLTAMIVFGACALRGGGPGERFASVMWMGAAMMVLIAQGALSVRFI